MLEEQLGVKEIQFVKYKSFGNNLDRIIYIQLSEVLHHKSLVGVRYMYLSILGLNFQNVFLNIVLSKRLLSFKEILNPVSFSTI